MTLMTDLVDFSQICPHSFLPLEIILFKAFFSKAFSFLTKEELEARLPRGRRTKANPQSVQLSFR
jgi:hypothetical protein